MGQHGSRIKQQAQFQDRDDSPERPPSYKTIQTQKEPPVSRADLKPSNNEFRKQLEALEDKFALRNKVVRKIRQRNVHLTSILRSYGKSRITANPRNHTHSPKHDPQNKGDVTEQDTESEETDYDTLGLEFIRVKVADLEAAVRDRDSIIKSQTEQLNSLGKKPVVNNTKPVSMRENKDEWAAMNNALNKLKSKSDAELEALLAKKPQLPDALYYSVREELKSRQADREYAMADDLL